MTFARFCRLPFVGTFRRMGMALALATIFIPSVAMAGSVKAEMSVSVTVLSRAVITVDDQPSSITVTADDIARGYVDMAVPMTVRVRTNSRSGYLLTVHRTTADFSVVDLTFAGGQIRLAGPESWIARPWIAQGDTLSLNARLTLAPGTEAGSHALPFALTVSPM